MKNVNKPPTLNEILLVSTPGYDVPVIEISDTLHLVCSQTDASLKLHSVETHTTLHDYGKSLTKSQISNIYRSFTGKDLFIDKEVEQYTWENAKANMEKLELVAVESLIAELGSNIIGFGRKPVRKRIALFKLDYIIQMINQDYPNIKDDRWICSIGLDGNKEICRCQAQREYSKRYSIILESMEGGKVLIEQHLDLIKDVFGID